MEIFDQICDVLVVGSGNGALTAAITAHDLAKADVLIVEKSDKIGGTSALSGGGVWIPMNRYAKEAGADDCYEDAFTYLQETIPANLFRPKMVNAYLKAGPEMIDFLHENTHVRYESLAKYPDYYTNKPGAREGHRSMEPATVAMSAVKDDVDNIRTGGVMYSFDKFAINQVDAQVMISRQKGWRKIFVKQLLGYYLDVPWLLGRRGFSRKTAGGGAGVIRLMMSVKDRNIPLYRDTAFKELITDNNKVIGAVIEREGKLLRVQAKKGVILAAGGFEHNQTMREQYLPKPTDTQWSAGCKSNTGDAIQAGQKVGAKLALMDNAWWCTTKVIPGKPYPFLSITSKSLPGSIVVNKAGKRFSNESQNYMAFLKETFAVHTEEAPCIPMYMIADSNFRKKRVLWPLVVPDRMLPKEYFSSGLLAVCDTVEELAEKMGIDANNLATTVERFNQFVDAGIDEDFHRGESAYDRYYGDPEFKPNPCLGKIIKPPFIAIRLDAGDFGTQGGLLTNVHGQVCDEQEQPISGLYATGNTTAAVLPTYPGPGSTLGPAMTFGYLAAKHISQQ